MDDKSYVARFSLQVAEFRGKYGRKGQVGGSAKDPTAGGSATAQSLKGKDSTKTNPQKLSEDEYFAAMSKAASKWKFGKDSNETFSKEIDGDSGVLVFVDFRTEDGVRKVMVQADDGSGMEDIFDEALTPDFGLEEAFAAADYQASKIADQVED